MPEILAKSEKGDDRSVSVEVDADARALVLTVGKSAPVRFDPAAALALRQAVDAAWLAVA
jgi:hypothetical protein